MPFVVTDDQLLLKADVHDGGEARIEVPDDGDKAICKFELNSSIPLWGRFIEQAVDWSGEAIEPCWPET